MFQLTFIQRNVRETHLESLHFMWTFDNKSMMQTAQIGQNKLWFLSLSLPLSLRVVIYRSLSLVLWLTRKIYIHPTAKGWGVVMFPLRNPNRSYTVAQALGSVGLFLRANNAVFFGESWYQYRPRKFYEADKNENKTSLSIIGRRAALRKYETERDLRPVCLVMMSYKWVGEMRGYEKKAVSWVNSHFHLQTSRQLRTKRILLFWFAVAGNVRVHHTKTYNRFKKKNKYSITSYNDFFYR